MSADKFAGRARRLAITAIAAERGLSTGIKHMPPSNDPDIKAAERAGWIARTSKRFGCWGSGRGRVTVFHATDAGRAALAKYGAPADPTVRNLGPSPKRRRQNEDRVRSVRIALGTANVASARSHEA